MVPVLSSYRHRAQLAFGSIVVGTKPSILDEPVEGVPLVVQVAQGIAQRGLGENRFRQGPSLCVDLGQDRHGALLT
jgi:hypothetical protein